MIKHLVIITLYVFLISSCSENKLPEENNSGNREIILEANFYYNWHNVLEKSIINDFFSPPVASRIYAYPNLAMYQLLQSQERSFEGKINNLPIPDENSTNANREIAALFAFYHTAKGLVFDQSFLDKYKEKFIAELEQLKFSKQEINKAEEYGKLYSTKILAFAKKDSYPQMRSFKKYEMKNVKGSWKPTPPDYFDGLEPFWSKLRPFFLDSASQFRPGPPTEYSEDKNSIFFKEMMETYDAVDRQDSIKNLISIYWDDAPMVLNHAGHATISDKKLTPVGHWLRINLSVCAYKKLSMKDACYANTNLILGIFDGFISCWDTKYHYEYIRPVTAINLLKDKQWLPLLYTPNFPEYTSGHSVVSGTASEIMTHLFGDNFTFTDSSEVPYGRDPRIFKSFFEACHEACISRLYGGIHFRPAIEIGEVQGKKIGKYTIAKTKMKSL